MKQLLVHIVQLMIVIYNVLIIIYVILFYQLHVYLVRINSFCSFFFYLYFKLKAPNGINKQAKIISIPRQTSTYICASSFAGTYANWWTYSVLLVNWFILFCFFLYLCNHFILNKITIILTSSIVILTFIMIIIYAVLWGIQCMEKEKKKFFFVFFNNYFFLFLFR
jgi:hypothetical protein